MTWKKVVEDKDLIVLEKMFKDFKVKIEARHEGGAWKIFKTYVHENKSNLVSEYSFATFAEVKKKISDLKKEKLFSLDEIRKIGSLDPTNIKTSLRRVYKEEFVEKWYVHLTSREEKNFIVVRYDSEIRIDFVINQKYRYMQDEINRQIEEKLGLREFSDFIHYHIYYYSEQVDLTMASKSPEPFIYGEIDIQFDLDEDN